MADQIMKDVLDEINISTMSTESPRRNGSPTIDEIVEMIIDEPSSTPRGSPTTLDEIVKMIIDKPSTKRKKEISPIPEQKKYKPNNPLQFFRVQVNEVKKCFDFIYEILEFKINNPKEIKNILYSYFQIPVNIKSILFDNQNLSLGQKYYFQENGFKKENIPYFYDIINIYNLCFIIHFNKKIDYIFFPLNLDEMGLIEIDHMNNKISRSSINLEKTIDLFYKLLLSPRKDIQVKFVMAPLNLECLPEKFKNEWIVSSAEKQSYEQYTDQKVKKFLIFMEKFGPQLNIWLYIKFKIGNPPTEKCLNKSIELGTESTILGITKDPCATQCGQTSNLFRYIFFGENSQPQKTNIYDISIMFTPSQVVDLVLNELQKNYYIEISVPYYDFFCGHIFSLFLFEGRYYWVESYIYKYPIKIKVYSYEEFKRVLTEFINVFKTNKWTQADIDILEKIFPADYSSSKIFPQGTPWSLSKLNGRDKITKVTITYYLYTKNKLELLKNFEKLLDYSSWDQEQIDRLNKVAPSEQERSKIFKNLDDIKCVFELLFKLDFFLDLSSVAGKIQCQEKKKINSDKVQNLVSSIQ
jgi:hypothetical protein